MIEPGIRSPVKWYMSWEALEEKPIGFFPYIVSLAAIMFSRNMFEAFSGTGFTEQAGSYLLHYPLAYVAPLLALSITLAAFSQVPVIKVTRLMLYVWLLTLLPPLVDIFITSGLDNQGTKIGYLTIPEGEYFRTFLNFFNPAASLEGTTVGIRVEALLASLLSLVYIRIKSRSWWRSIVGTIVVFAVSFFFFTFPYVYLSVVKLFDSGVHNLTELFLSPGILIRTDTSRISLIMAQADVIVAAIILFVWYGMYSGVRELRRTARILCNRHTGYAALMTMAGFALGGTIILPYDSFWKLVSHHADIASLISVLLASIGAGAAVSSLEKGNASETSDGTLFPHREFLVVLLTFAAINALTVGFPVFCFLLLYLSVMAVRAVPPLEFRRYPILSALSLSVASVALICMSYSLFVGTRVPTFLPGVLLSVLFTSLFIGFLAVELYRAGDGNLYSHGSKRKLVPGILLFVAYVVPLLLFHDPAFVMLSIGVAILSSILSCVSSPRRFAGTIFVLYLVTSFGLLSRDLRDLREPFCGNPQQILHAEMASVFRSEGRTDLARAELEEAARLGSPDPLVYFNLGTEYAGMGNNLLAAEMFSRVTELDSTYGEAYYNLALAYARIGRTDMVLTNLEAASRHIESNPEVKLKIARLLMENNRLTAALSLMFQDLSEEPREQLLVFELTQRAIRSLSEEHPDTTSPAGRYLSQLTGAVADENSETMDAALDDLRALESEFPEVLITPFYKAWLLQKSGDTRAAVDQYRLLLKKIPSFYEARMNIGVAYMDLGNFEESRKAFSSILSMNPDDTKALINIANSYSKEGRLEESTAYLNRVLVIEPESYPARFNLAMVFEKLMKIDRAIEQYEMLITLGGASSAVYTRLSGCYMQKGDTAKARVNLEKAMNLDPDNTRPTEAPLSLER